MRRSIIKFAMAAMLCNVVFIPGCAGDEVSGDGFEKNIWFGFYASELPAELTGDAAYYKICQTGAMEYAILDVSTYALGEKGWNEKQLFETYPLLEPTGKLFLKREEGAGTWQAQVLDFESLLPHQEEGHPGIAFEDGEHGMIMFGWWYTVLIVTEDGGETWKLTGSVPKPGTGDHNRADCITNCGENRYLIGYRYLTEPCGSIWLTKDNGGNWEQVTIAIPETEEKFCYVEPVEFVYDGKVVSLTACMKLEDEKGQRSEVCYVTVSEDGGETWKLKK